MREESCYWSRTQRARMAEAGDDPEAYLDQIIAADHARGRGAIVGLHMCRGNNRSAWHAEGTPPSLPRWGA